MFWPFRSWRQPPDPGPPRVDAASLIARARRLRFRVRRGSMADLIGAYQGSRAGSGLAFAELRPYEPGDEVRHLDWNASARQGRPFVRRFAEERALTVWLVVDVSASLRFGPDGASKADRAVQAAALLATAASRSGDQAGLILVSDRVEAEIPPGLGPRHLARVIRTLVVTPSRSRKTDLAKGLAGPSRSRRRALIVVLGDFLGDELAPAWEAATRRHDVVAMRVVEPRELRLPPAGLLDLVDAETGATRVIDAGSRRVRDAYARAADDRARRFRSWCGSSGVIGLDLPTAADPMATLIGFFSARARQRGRP